MRLELEIKNTENIQGMNQADRQQMVDIFEALITTGSLTGVRGGQVLIHFDHEGKFQKVQHSYFPFVKRTLDKRGR